MTEKKKPTPGPILVAVDFSPSSRDALLWAARAARDFDASLVALHVVNDPSSAPGYYEQVKKRKKHLTRIEEAAEETMSNFLDKVKRDHPKLLASLKHRLVVGIPVSRILEVAEKIDAQLIVMGSHGRTGLPSILLGSKAEKVVRLAEVPVTIVKSRQKKK